MKQNQLTALAAALFLAFPILAQAQAQITIKVATTEAANRIRNDIGRATFGTGIEAGRAEMRWAMQPVSDPNTSAEDKAKLALTADNFKWLQLGTFRFPGGQPSANYFFDQPWASYGANWATDDWNRWLSPQEIIDYTSPSKLNMERFNAVNTNKTLSPEKRPPGETPYDYIYPPPDFPFFFFSPTNLNKAADKAAEWVEADKGQTQFWEVASEDWSRITGHYYAEIFSKFQEKMLSKRPDIKLIASGLEQNFEGKGAMGPNTVLNNTPSNWLAPLVSKLRSQNKLNSVYAYAVHDYISAKPYPPGELNENLRRSQTEEMLKIVDDHTKEGGTDLAAVKRLLKENGLNWKIWMPEFNVMQAQLKPDSTACTEIDNPNCWAVLQDVGHGLVIADWVGKLLEQNVERLFLFDLGQSQLFGLVDFGKDKNNLLKTPKISVPGFVYSMYAKNFGQTMVKNTIMGNNNVPNQAYTQLGVYSSIDSNDQELRIMVVNRDLNNKAIVNIDTQSVPGRRELADGQYCFRKLSSAQISDSNVTQKDKVTWTPPLYKPQSNQSGVVGQVLDAGSVNLFVIPLVPVGAPNKLPAHQLVSCGDEVKTSVDLGGFETPVKKTPNYEYQPQNAGWMFGIGSGIQRNGSAWGAAAAPEGQQTAFLQGENARVSKMVNLKSGIHNISFYAARRPYNGHLPNPIEVRVNGILIGQAIKPFNTEFSKYTTTNFPLASDGNYKVEFISKQAGDFTTLIDSGSVNRIQSR